MVLDSLDSCGDSLFRCLGRLGGVEEEEESEEELGEVPGLSALFSACTSMNAYSVVSIRVFLI